MPELPEVETVRRSLEPHLLGRTLAGAELRLRRMLEVGTPAELSSRVGASVTGLTRHGKYLLVELSDGWTLVVHLGMTGQLTCQPAGAGTEGRFVRLVTGYMRAVGPQPVDRHTHLVLELAGGDRVLFRDPRTFGRVLLLAPGTRDGSPRLARLGPDALGLAPAAFAARFREARGKRSVKSVLMDQAFVAGLGNIYVDEACFGAGVRPRRRSTSLTAAAVLALGAAVQEVLARGLANCGTSFRDYVDADGRAGSNQEDLYVYGRAGLPCRRCGTRLAGAVHAQRATVWCPRCQR